MLATNKNVYECERCKNTTTEPIIKTLSDKRVKGCDYFRQMQLNTICLCANCARDLGVKIDI